MTKVTYSEGRANLAKLWDQTVSNGEPVYMTRRGKPDVALISAAELSSLLETVHLFSSPANAKRLFEAMARADENPGKTETMEELRKSLNFYDTE